MSRTSSSIVERLGITLVSLLLVVVAILASNGMSSPVPQRIHTEVSIIPTFLSPAPPNLFVGENFSYALSSQVPVNWTCLTCPLSVVVGGPLSKLAGLHGTPTASGTLAFSIRITDAAYNGGISAWQNWTSSVLAKPKIITTPSFVVVPTLLYDYKPAKVGGVGSWSFSGAPYFSLNATTGEVKGTPTNGTYLNDLTFSVSGTSWSQFWLTSPSPVPSFVTFQTTIGSHAVTATLPTDDVAGSGYGGIYLGIYPLLNSTNYAASDAYNFTYFQSVSSYELGAVGVTNTVTIDVYAQPLATVTPKMNGVSLSPVAEPSSGFSLVGYSPLQIPSGLKVTPQAGDTVLLTWFNPVSTYSNISISYGLLRPTGCAIVNGTGVSVHSAATSVQLSGLTPSVTYCFAIQGWSAGFASAFSNVVVLKTPNMGGPPPFPISIPGVGAIAKYLPPFGVLVGYLVGGLFLFLGLIVALAAKRRNRQIGWVVVLLVWIGLVVLFAVYLDQPLFARVL